MTTLLYHKEHIVNNAQLRLQEFWDGIVTLFSTSSTDDPSDRPSLRIIVMVLLISPERMLNKKESQLKVLVWKIGEVCEIFIEIVRSK